MKRLMELIRRFNWLFAFLKHISQLIKGVRKEKLFEVNGTLIHQCKKNDRKNSVQSSPKSHSSCGTIYDPGSWIL